MLQVVVWARHAAWGVGVGGIAVLAGWRPAEHVESVSASRVVFYRVRCRASLVVRKQTFEAASHVASGAVVCAVAVASKAAVMCRSGGPDTYGVVQVLVVLVLCPYARQLGCPTAVRHACRPPPRCSSLSARRTAPPLA